MGAAATFTAPIDSIMSGPLEVSSVGPAPPPRRGEGEISMEAVITPESVIPKGGGARAAMLAAPPAVGGAAVGTIAAT